MIITLILIQVDGKCTGPHCQKQAWPVGDSSAVVTKRDAVENANVLRQHSRVLPVATVVDCATNICRFSGFISVVAQRATALSFLSYFISKGNSKKGNSKKGNSKKGNSLSSRWP